MRRVTFFALMLAVPVVLAGSAGLAAESKNDATTDPMSACADTMQAQGASEEGKKAMRDFMQSDRAPQAMANMMEMARRMGNGDVMLGMTRMMEMMGSGGMGGMMGGSGPMAPPAGR